MDNYMKKTVVTITGIRPDFIRMSFVFKELDKEFNHILIHTGQHFDKSLSDVFFNQLGIRDPDFILETGKIATNHFEQLAYLSTAIPKLFKEKNINPDLILFLGDSNSAGAAFPLKKEGYTIGHIEAGMRSYDKRMLEELNRTVCDHCSDILFVYHDDYKEQLEKENIVKNVFVVGNTIVEPFNMVKEHIFKQSKRNDMILMDIHRPENFKYEDRLKNVLAFGNICVQKFGVPVKLLYFKRLQDAIEKWNLDLGNIEMIPLLPYIEYLETVYHSKFIISDSGTGQEEPALLNTRVIVPRDYTERPRSYSSGCSFQLKINNGETNYGSAFDWINTESMIDASWLGDGNTSKTIVSGIKDFFQISTIKSATEYAFDDRSNCNDIQKKDASSYLSNIQISSDIYKTTPPYPHMFQNNFLDNTFAKELQTEIMNIPSSEWDRYENPFEQKFTLRDKYNFPEKLSAIFDELTSDKFVSHLSDVVGHKLLLDETRNFWGVHKYGPGDKLDIHVDAGLHPTMGIKKLVTLGIYLSYDWKEEYGCNLEIWRGENSANNDAKLIEKVKSISPLFNRMVLFTCDDYSWHGNPEPALCPHDSVRIFVTLSYLCENTTDKNTRKKAFFIARPDDPIDAEKDKLRLLRADPEKYKDVYRI